MADDGNLNEYDLEINLRPPSEVAGRLLALVALARRGFLERPLEVIADDTPEAERFDLLSWMGEERLAEYLTATEQAILNAPNGSLSPEDTAAATWSIEGAVVLAWALQKVPVIPDYDQITAAASVIEVLPAPWSRTTEFRSAAVLQDEADIVQARERAEVWHDRAEQYWFVQDGWELDLITPSEVIAMMANEAYAAGLIPSPVYGDFPTRHGVYRDLSPETVEQLELIAFHRLVEFNWLCGLIESD